MQQSNLTSMRRVLMLLCHASVPFQTNSSCKFFMTFLYLLSLPFLLHAARFVVSLPTGPSWIVS